MYSRILVPLDGSPTADLALHHAAVLARLNGATIVLLHVIEEMKHSGLPGGRAEAAGRGGAAAEAGRPGG